MSKRLNLYIVTLVACTTYICKPAQTYQLPEFSTAAEFNQLFGQIQQHKGKYQQEVENIMVQLEQLLRKVAYPLNEQIKFLLPVLQDAERSKTVAELLPGYLIGRLNLIDSYEKKIQNLEKTVAQLAEQGPTYGSTYLQDTDLQPIMPESIDKAQAGKNSGNYIFSEEAAENASEVEDLSQDSNDQNTKEEIDEDGQADLSQVLQTSSTTDIARNAAAIQELQVELAKYMMLEKEGQAPEGWKGAIYRKWQNVKKWFSKKKDSNETELLKE